MHIVLTDAASAKLRSIIEENSGFIRIHVKRKGCAGISYSLQFVDQLADTDEKAEINKLPLYFDRSCAMYIIGTRIDYRDDLSGREFVFGNDAFQPCGCGKSFRGEISEA